MSDLERRIIKPNGEMILEAQLVTEFLIFLNNGASDEEKVALRNSDEWGVDNINHVDNPNLGVLEVNFGSYLRDDWKDFEYLYPNADFTIDEENIRQGGNKLRNVFSINSPAGKFFVHYLEDGSGSKMAEKLWFLKNRLETETDEAKRLELQELKQRKIEEIRQVIFERIKNNAVDGDGVELRTG